MTLILSKAEVRRYLSMKEIIERMESAFVAFQKGEVLMPQRTRIAMPDSSGYGAFMPCCMPGAGGFGIKVNTNFRLNPSRSGLPPILGLILLLDMGCGKPLAIMDSTLITAFRTGAVSGLAMKYLARKDAAVVSILGSGALSLPHIQAAIEVRKIMRVLVYSPGLAAKLDAFLQVARQVTSASIEVANSAEQAVRPADIVVTCTNSTSPVLDGRWLKEGACLLATGNANPKTRELDSNSVLRSKVVCDSWKACILEAGDLLLPIQEGLIGADHVKLDLAEVIQEPGRGRAREDEIILFKSVGLAFQDIVTASHVYRRASEEGCGLQLDFYAEQGRRGN